VVLDYQINILGYQTVSILTSVLTGSLLSLLYLGCKTIRLFHSDILSFGPGASRSTFIFSGVSLVAAMDAEGPGVFAAKVNGIGNRWSGDTIMRDADHTQFEAFLGNFETWDYFPHLLKYQDFWSTSIWIKGILGRENVN
jgi:hypothetical protein